jgi:hypothetical protein
MAGELGCRGFPPAPERVAQDIPWMQNACF